MIKYWAEAKELEQYRYLQVVGYDDRRAYTLRAHLGNLLQQQGRVEIAKVSDKFGVYELTLEPYKFKREKIRKGIPKVNNAGGYARSKPGGF